MHSRLRIASIFLVSQIISRNREIISGAGTVQGTRFIVKADVSYQNALIPLATQFHPNVHPRLHATRNSWGISNAIISICHFPVVFRFQAISDHAWPGVLVLRLRMAPSGALVVRRHVLQARALGLAARLPAASTAHRLLHDIRNILEVTLHRQLLLRRLIVHGALILRW